MKSRLRKVSVTQYPQLPAGYNPEMAVILDTTKKTDIKKDVYKDYENMSNKDSRQIDKQFYTF